MRLRSFACVLAWLIPAVAAAQEAASRPQTQEDDYTRYELLAPETAQFRILYEVTATTPGARFFFNTIRKGSIASDERVVDPMTGQALDWGVVGGRQARAEGHPAADLDTDYIKVRLARPVPPNGQVRVLIDKTYKDAQSYKREGDTIVFDRSLGIRRNSVVLPAGYALASCNVPSQILTTQDGRVMISFMNPGPAAAPLVIKARPGFAPFTRPSPATRPGDTHELQTRLPSPSHSMRLVERAHDDREAIYELGDPATHAFGWSHDHTEIEPRMDRHVNVAPPGSTVSNPSAIRLDTGAVLEAKVVKGDAIRDRRLDSDYGVRPDAEAVLVPFDAVNPGQSLRLRISGTYTDPRRYFVDGEELVWEASADGPRNTVILPVGWSVVGSAMPATIATDTDGRQRLVFENPRPDALQLLIRARRLAK